MGIAEFFGSAEVVKQANDLGKGVAQVLTSVSSSTSGAVGGPAVINQVVGSIYPVVPPQAAGSVGLITNSTSGHVLFVQSG
jgi:hypothetical protein